jgi:5'-deoxy-5'-methylthioadenosine phosphorylase
MLAIVGGSGLTSFAEIEIERREVIRTPFGEPSAPLTFGRLGDEHIVFLPRHGYGHTIPPHYINYRANIWALHHIGVRGVIAVAAVGGIRADMLPGAIVLPDQVIDYTWGRASTYFDSRDMPVTHIDFTLPFDGALRARLLAAARVAGETLIDGACYACTQGPRLETAAEINRLAGDGADIVGMTLMPEAALARELAMPYVALAVVANYAAGRGTSATEISTADIGRTLEHAIEHVRGLIVASIHPDAQANLP